MCGEACKARTVLQEGGLVVKGCLYELTLKKRSCSAGWRIAIHYRLKRRHAGSEKAVAAGASLCCPHHREGGEAVGRWTHRPLPCPCWPRGPPGGCQLLSCNWRLCACARICPAEPPPSAVKLISPSICSFPRNSLENSISKETEKLDFSSFSTSC